MTQYVPLAAVPSQVCTVTLGGQRCIIEVDQKDVGSVYLSLTANGISIVNFRLCRDRVSLVRSGYLPFSGTLSFVDTQGTSDPDYSGFGSRYRLVYLP